MIFQFCRPIWKRWFRDALLAGVLPLVSAATYAATPLVVTAVKHNPPKWDWIDPLKDLQAEELAVNCGFKARDDSIEASGFDPEEVDARIRAGQLRATSEGIKFLVTRTGYMIAPDDAQEELPAPATTPPAGAPAAPGKPGAKPAPGTPAPAKPAPGKKPAQAKRQKRKIKK